MIIARAIDAYLSKRVWVIRTFRAFWLVLLLSFVLALRSHIWFSREEFIFWHRVAVLCGKFSLVFFIITLAPGIFQRFGIRNRLLGIIMVFRRQFGDTMFLLALFHGMIVGIVDAVSDGHPLRYNLFEWYGISSVVLLLFLFVTSNNWSKSRLGKNWFLLHRLVYVVMWLVLFHLALQSLNVWTLIAALLVLAEMSGIIYGNLRKRGS